MCVSSNEICSGMRHGKIWREKLFGNFNSAKKNLVGCRLRNGTKNDNGMDQSSKFRLMNDLNLDLNALAPNKSNAIKMWKIFKHRTICNYCCVKSISGFSLLLLFTFCSVVSLVLPAAACFFFLHGCVFWNVFVRAYVVDGFNVDLLHLVLRFELNKPKIIIRDKLM